MTEEVVNSAILELIELGNGVGGVRIGADTTSEEIHNLLRRSTRRQKHPRPQYLNEEVLEAVAQAGDMRLQARIKADRPNEPLSSEVLDRVAHECAEYFTDLAKQRNQSE